MLRPTPEKESFKDMSALEDYLTFLRVTNYSPNTIHTRKKNLTLFKEWLGDKDISQLNEEDIYRYIEYQKEKGIKEVTIQGRICLLKRWFDFLEENELILYNPLLKINLSSKASSLPRDIPPTEVIIKLLSSIEGRTYIGIRDRAILELLYSTAIRCMELLNLLITDIDLNKGLLTIRCGKGDKYRVVPIGKVALAAIKRYLNISRPYYLKDSNKLILFLTTAGGKLGPGMLIIIIDKYRRIIRYPKRITSHHFRHAAAMGMLKNGADIAYIQQLLGHNRLSSTQIYTRLSPQDLKEAIPKYHPRDKFIRAY